MAKVYRIGIVGAASLGGKELSDELGESPLAASDLVLLDDEDEAAGKLTAAGDEPAFIQKIEPDAFARLDFDFFTGDTAVTQRHWKEARQAGATIIDLTYALENEKDAMVLAPWVSEALGTKEEGRKPHLGTQVVVPAHPIAMMLGLLGARLQSKLSLSALAATVMEPASEHGRAAMDEMHQQT